ncbi:M48 family metallopeptidase [Chitinophaga japonensis]|uniref:Zn-dependent protease with chaperone function n=1 Tax=Chitinophaga japonensis TaxID=104662 RepID=A0A562TC64_CHIJA|nr:M48 family metallopeptidase [Chitinophaga japonensis]TWI90868.1 Zn-dependent protease with chaperone function [Chitinophaga japonensis]
MSNSYQANPTPADPVLPSPAPLLQRQLLKVTSFIALFFLVYVLLLLGMAGLGAAFITGGIMLATAMHRVLAIITALPMVLLGAMLLAFPSRFVFGRKKRPYAYRALLQRSEHPQLFAFVAQLAAITRTTCPEKIFAVPGMQATLLPPGSLLRLAGARLEIGLGLVNSLNRGEFRMMLARTLGHCSQRSVQLGSFIGAQHQRIYYMLYESGTWHNHLVSRAMQHLLLHPLGRIATGIAGGMQFLLRKLYQLIHQAYIPLSREMELHADAIGCSIAGSEAAISALRRAEVGGACFEHCLHKLPLLAEKQLRFRNLYAAHRTYLHHYALQNGLALDAARLPVVTDAYLESFIKSQVQFRQQGAAQPDREEREQRCQAAAVVQETATGSAWELFHNPAGLQETMTAMIYDRGLPAHGSYHWYTPQELLTELEQQYRQLAFPGAFHQYYDNRPFTALTAACQQPLAEAELSRHSMASLYAPAYARQIRQLFRNRQDAATLQAIAAGEIRAGAFEFRGQPYPAASAGHLLDILQADIAQQEAWLEAQDHLAFRVHYSRALHQGRGQAEDLLQKYRRVLQHQEKAQLLETQVSRIIHCTGDLFGATGITMEQARPYFDILEAESARFRQLLQELWQNPELANAWEPELRQKTGRFLQQPASYLDSGIPLVTAIQLLHEICVTVPEHYHHYITRLQQQYLAAALALEVPGLQTTAHGAAPGR